MAYIRVVVKGAIGAFDNWSTSAAFGIVGLAPDVPDQALVDDMATRLAAWSIPGAIPTSLKGLVGSQATMNAWRVEKRDESEDLLSVGEAGFTSVVTGTNGATKTPQDAIVLSLRTTLPGAKGRGRMYWPAMGATLGADFVLTSPTAAATAADAKTFLNGITTQLNAAYAASADVRTVRLAVRSQADHVCRDVTQIQVGNYLDTQRRRRDKFRETYSSVVYT
jgi:hypothetical protein